MIDTVRYAAQNFNPDGSRRYAAGSGRSSGSITSAGDGSYKGPAFSIGVPSGSRALSFALPATGQLPPPAKSTAAAGNSPLRVPQRAMVIGEPIPVVFGRRRGTVGGVLVFPPATEARFENTSTTVTSRYHMVLGEGQIGSVQVRDARNGESRIGSFSQNYGKRAGSWTTGNFATSHGGVTPIFPTYTGGGGNYSGITTIEAGATFHHDSDEWKTGWNFFVREGMTIERGRLVDGVVGASDNIADLVLWAWQRSSRVPAAMIDMDSMVAAAKFVEVNGLWCNGLFEDSANLGDFVIRILPSFLLRETRVGGKYGLRPLLPANPDGSINTTPLVPRWLLDERIIKPDSFQSTNVEASARKAPILNMIWRQQADETDIAVPRTLPIGTTNNTDKPEQRDLSQFCTSELHASRVGSYEYARRVLTGHTATVKLRPGSQTGRIKEGDVVQIYLRVEADGDTPWFYNYYYQVESVGADFTGEETLSLTHFPVDADGRSLLADAVVNAPTTGIILPSQKTGPSGDVAGRDTDTSVPAGSSIGTPFTPPGQPSWPPGVPPFTPPEQPPANPPAPPPPGMPGRPVPDPPPALPLGSGAEETSKVYLVSGTTYNGFNTFSSYNQIAYSRPVLQSIEKANTGADVVRPWTFGQGLIPPVGIDPSRVTLSFKVALTLSASQNPNTGLVTITGNDDASVGLIFGRFQQYNSEFYGYALLWDQMYAASVVEIGTVDGSGIISYYPTAKPVYNWS